MTAGEEMSNAELGKRRAKDETSAPWQLEAPLDFLSFLKHQVRNC